MIGNQLLDHYHAIRVETVQRLVEQPVSGLLAEQAHEAAVRSLAAAVRKAKEGAGGAKRQKR